MPFRFLLTTLFAAFIGTIVILADSGYRKTLFGFVDLLPGGDKLGHLVLMGFLSLLVTWSLYPRTLHIGRVSVPLGLLLVLVASTLEEYSQLWFPVRTFSLIDLACNIVGIVVGGMFMLQQIQHLQPIALPNDQ